MYNQNINSQAMNAANLGRDQMDVTEHYLAAALLTGVQAVEVRSLAETGSCDAREILSDATVPLYLAARTAADGEPKRDRTIVWDDMDGFLQPKVEGLLSEIAARGAIHEALRPLRSALDAFRS